MKEASISELKAHLSEYLAAVRAGDTVIVRDRRTPIARLSPLEPPEDDFQVEEPSGPFPPLSRRGSIRLARQVDVVALLRDDREQR